MRTAILLLASTIAIGGCAGPNAIYPDDQNKNVVIRSDKLSVRFESKSEESKNYRVHKVLIPTRDNNGVVTEIKYWQSKRPGPKRFVIILPIYGSRTPEYLPIVLAKRLTYKNKGADFNVALIREKGDLFDWDKLTESRTIEEFRSELSESVQRILQATREILGVLDWATGEPSIDPARAGIAGFSSGCIVATIAMGVDRRINAGALTLCGGDLHEILAYSEADFIKKVQDNALRKFAKTRDEIRDIAKEALASVNPSQFAEHIPPEKVILFDAEFDSFIPLSARDGLWRALQKPTREPTRIILPHDHKMSFLSMTPLWGNYTDKKIAAFFREKL